MHRLVGSRRVVAALVAAALPLVPPAAASAHGPVEGPPDMGMVLTGWSFDIEVWLPVLLAAWGYLVLVRSVDRAHPTNPVPRRRVWCWMGGLAVLLVSTQSVIGRYDTTLFTFHMVQHLLLTMVAAPLLLLGAPVTLLLRAASSEARTRWILPVLHSRVVAAVSHPIVAWTQFAVVMWASHFTSLFDAALEDPLIHLMEHALYLGSAMLFWWPVVAVDPAPRRLSHPMRIGYLLVGMPFSSFLGLAIFSATEVLYAHYATLARDWGQSPLVDQQWAGGIMWAGGDMVFFVAMVLAVAAWLRAEEAEGRRIDSILDRERAAAVLGAAVPGAAGEGAPGVAGAAPDVGGAPGAAGAAPDVGGAPGAAAALGVAVAAPGAGVALGVGGASDAGVVPGAGVAPDVGGAPGVAAVPGAGGVPGAGVAPDVGGVPGAAAALGVGRMPDAGVAQARAATPDDSLSIDPTG